MTFMVFKSLLASRPSISRTSVRRAKWLCTLAYPQLERLHPFQSTYSVGLVDADADALNETLLGYRKEADGYIAKRQVRNFIEVAAKAARELGQLPKNHRLHFNEHFMFLRGNAPAAPVFDEIMAKVFNKVCDLDPRCKVNLENTSSGYAIGGLPGVGKSVILRLSTTLAAVLLPQVVSAYVDAEAHMMTRQSTSTVEGSVLGKTVMTPYSLLMDAYQLRKNEFGWLRGELPFMKDPNCIASLAANNGVVTMLCVDELRAVYDNIDVWSQLHQLATSSNTTLLVADSSSRIGPLIRSDSDTRSQALVKKWYGVVNPSLNDTKLALLSLHPMRTKEQYQKYLECRVPKEMLEERSSEGVEGLHILTNGRIRSVMNLLTSLTEYQKYVKRVVVPVEGTWQRFVLDKLRKEQDKRGWTSAFDMVGKSFEDIGKWYEEFRHPPSKEASGTQSVAIQDSTLGATELWEVVEDLVSNKVLTVIPGPNANGVLYTFAQPLQYFQLTNMAPKVFIAHAAEDEEAVLRIKSDLEIAGAHVTIWQQDEAKVQMMVSGMSNWMEKQTNISGAAEVRENFFCIIVLSEPYLQKLNKVCGVSEEAGLFSSQLTRDDGKDNGIAARRVVVTRVCDLEKITTETDRVPYLKTLINTAPTSGAHGYSRWIPDLRDGGGISTLATRILGRASALGRSRPVQSPLH